MPPSQPTPGSPQCGNVALSWLALAWCRFGRPFGRPFANPERAAVLLQRKIWWTVSSNTRC